MATTVFKAVRRLREIAPVAGGGVFMGGFFGGGGERGGRVAN